MSFELKIKRIDSRVWSSIRQEWFNYLPVIDPAGKSPEDSISELPELIGHVEGMKYNGELHLELPSLRGPVFHESLFLLHKSINVSATSELNIDNGYLTWSLSTGYHSSFFAVKSLLGFLGISLPRIQGKDVIFDIWAKGENLSSKQIKRGEKPKPAMKLVRLPSIQHYMVWKIFQRVLRVSNIGVWEESCVSLFLGLGEKDFASQRNQIHYLNNTWPLEDLHIPKTIKMFGQRNDLERELYELNPAQIDFSVILSFVLIHMALALLKDLGQGTPIVQNEIDLIEKKLEGAFHLLYKEIHQ